MSFGQVEIVEAHDRDVMRTMEAGIPDGEKDAEGDHVVAGKDCRGTGNQTQKDQCFGVPPCLSNVVSWTYSGPRASFAL